LIHTDKAVPGIFTEKGKGHVNRDAIEPGKGSGVGPKAVDRVIGFDKNVLGNIGGIGDVMDDIVDDGEEVLLVDVNELTKGGLGTVFNRSDEGVLVICGSGKGTFRVPGKRDFIGLSGKETHE
jgi:hypothetical protein